MSTLFPTELQLDALREVANIGCGHAARALSQLVGGRKVQIDVPRVVVAPTGNFTELLGGPDAPLVAATLEVEGELTGRLLVVLPESDAHRLCGLLLNSPSAGAFEEAQKSALGEVANILGSACLGAIGKLIGLRLVPSVPTLVQDIAGAVVEDALAKGDRQDQLGVVLEARFSTSSAPPIGGQMLVLPDRPSLKTLLQRLGV